MTTIYKVRAAKNLSPDDPLHVSRFFSFARLHRASMQERQDLILYLAQLHATALADGAVTGRPRGFCEVPIRLTSLREWVYDYRVVLDHFFTVKQTGFCLPDGTHEISTLIPKDLGQSVVQDRQLTYLPPPRPDGGVVSKVHVQRQNADAIREWLAIHKRADLKAPCEWLFTQPEWNFIFQPSGKLQLRDTSVWPIKAIETWPSWLREKMFGPGLDIESAYTQFIVSKLVKIRGSLDKVKLVYPDIVRSVHDKQAWRHELCALLGIDTSDASISLVKTICMSIANGSRISPAILSSGTGFSVTAESIILATEDVSEANLRQIGNRLGHIAKQYASAKRALCIGELGLNPSRTNQKRVFSSYFKWERDARYAIWEEVEQHGIMVHDGIDGIPESYLQDIPALIERVGLRVTT